MESDRSSLLSEFVSVTGVDQERAKFYLESSGWKLEIALASFFDDDGEAPDPPPPAQPQPVSAPPQSKPKQSRFGTVGGLKQNEKKGDEEGQEYYAGGSQESGEVIIGPSKKKSASKFVEDMMKSARDHGAEEVQSSHTEINTDQTSAFVGSGFRLGETEQDPIQRVQGKSAPPKKIVVVLKLWKNGFSLDDGALRDYQNPDNKEFLDSIHEGSIPSELRSLARGGEVNLDMEDHREEEFVAPKVALKAFTGSGNMLGSPAPRIVSQTSPALAEKHETMAKATLVVDPSKPTTRLQIRLADGTRLVNTFNHTHKVADVRNYILTARPQFGAGSFTLLTTFPNKEITNEQQTLTEAQLLNAVIVQKMK